MKYRIIVLGIILLFVSLFYFSIYPRLPIISGFAAHTVCSCTFIAGRELASIEEGDLDFSPISLASNEIDFAAKTASSSVFGLSKRIAIYREGYGCTMLPGPKTELDELSQFTTQKEPASDSLYWPYGSRIKDTLFQEIDYDALEKAVANAFDKGQEKIKKTRAVVVVYKNQLITERYAPGFDENTEILGWSMTKSIINALLGIFVKEGVLDIHDNDNLDEWKGDERKNITINDLLQMNSGLEWIEDYSTKSDVTKMLYNKEDIPGYALSKPLEFPPGTHWEYSSGTSNILSAIIRKKFDSHSDYLQFPSKALFEKIGMYSAVMELDVAGNFIGSSYSYATPRDWAKFGLLYLNDGKWNGVRILPEGWVKYSATPAPNAEGIYGAHFWLNAGHSAYPDVPDDLFSANGFQGQYTFIIPSKEMVIVRMGLTEGEEFDVNEFLKDILKAVE